MADIRNLSQTQSMTSLRDLQPTPTIKRTNTEPVLPTTDKSSSFKPNNTVSSTPESRTLDKIRSSSSLQTSSSSQMLKKSGISGFMQNIGYVLRGSLSSLNDFKNKLFSDANVSTTTQEYNLAKAKLYALERQNAGGGVPKDIMESAQQRVQELEKQMEASSPSDTSLKGMLKFYGESGAGLTFLNKILARSENPRDLDAQAALALFKVENLKSFAPENLLYLQESMKLSRLADQSNGDMSAIDSQIMHMVDTYVKNSGEYSLNLASLNRKTTVKHATEFGHLLQQLQQQEANLKGLQRQGITDKNLLENAQNKIDETRRKLDEVRPKVIDAMSLHIDEVKVNMREQASRVTLDQDAISNTKALKDFGTSKSWTRKWSNFKQIMFQGDNGWKTFGKSLGSTLLALTGIGAIGLAIGFASTSSTDTRGMSPEAVSFIESYQKYAAAEKALGL